MVTAIVSMSLCGAIQVFVLHWRVHEGSKVCFTKYFFEGVLGLCSVEYFLGRYLGVHEVRSSVLNVSYA